MACLTGGTWVGRSSGWAQDGSPEARLRAALELIMGPLPGADRRVELAPEFAAPEPIGGCFRQTVTFTVEPGERLSAFLLLPDAATVRGAGPRSRFPGILALHQTHDAGNRVVAGLGRSPDDEYGVELARRGYVVIAPPYPHLAGYAPDLKGLGYVSGTMKAVWNNVRSLDLLASLPAVAVERGFGAIGHSLGGHTALFTAAFDARLRAIATSCAFDSFRDYYEGNPEVWLPGRGWCQERYMPRLAEYRGRLEELPFDFAELLALIAPRRVWVSAPLGDSNFRWRSVDRVVAAARAQSAARGVTARIEVEHPDIGHRFPPELRERAYRMFDEELGSRP